MARKRINVKIGEDQLVQIINGKMALKRDGFEIVDAYVDRVKKDGVIVVFASIEEKRRPAFLEIIKSIIRPKKEVVAR